MPNINVHTVAGVCPMELIQSKASGVSSLLKQVSSVSFNKLKEEIKVAITEGSKLALAVDAWTG